MRKKPIGVQGLRYLPPALQFCHYGNFCRPILADTDMYRAIFAVEVEPVKRSVCNDPLRHLQHIFILNNEVNGSAEPITDRFPEPIAFMT